MYTTERNRVWRDFNPTTLATSTECDACHHDLTAVLGSIDQRLEERTAEGAEGQREEWPRRARAARRALADLRQRVALRRGVLAREERAATHKALGAGFQRVVRRAVDDATYARWMREAEVDCGMRGETTPVMGA